MNIELISVGTELLLGDIVNTNAQYLSKELANLGINVFRQSTVGDNIDRLVECFDMAFKNADIVITTGGLGPTTDDITKEAAAKYLGQEMVVHEESWKIIEDMCAKFSGSKNNIPSNNIRQAMFPKEAIILPNSNGTAPGAIFVKEDKKIIVMPGPPREMKAMFKERVLPFLMSNASLVLKSKYIRFYGIGESALEIKLIDLLSSQTNPTIALYAKEGEVLIRITAKGEDEGFCDRLIYEKIKEVKAIVGEYIYLIGDDSISESQTELDSVALNLLKKNNLTISIAESCTGGLLSSSIINIPGSSDVLLEGCVTYSNEAKMKRLGVKKETLDKFGAVSSETAIQMASGVRKSLGADVGISTTGIAGPDGGSDKKPVGLVYIGVSTKDGDFSIKNIFTGDRNRIRMKATREALNQIRLLFDKTNR